ncbi:head-tail connector protein [Coprococcus comes]|uniref:head-tail connector protein n=1 Tax=Coprococcus comes TaxID=410072 RepID=UPI001A9A7A91|nr:head-tail connector protein [Coprococcus comes]
MIEKLNERITIEKSTVVTDKIGNHRNTWEEYLRSTCRVAILYALGYLYEHRDEADHHQLMLTLRSILFAVREGVF